MQEENAAEGIELPEADFSEIDNGAVVKLIGGRPAGILHALNEECVVPKGTDQTMLDKLFEHHKANPLLTKPLKPREAFTVKHLPGGPRHLPRHQHAPKEQGPRLGGPDGAAATLALALCAGALLVEIRRQRRSSRRRKRRASRESPPSSPKQLDELLKLIGYSHMHFIRCIKPNRDKVPAIFIDELARRLDNAEHVHYRSENMCSWRKGLGALVAGYDDF